MKKIFVLLLVLLLSVNIVFADISPQYVPGPLEMTIYAHADGESSSINTSGHGFVVFTNYTGQTVKIGSYYLSNYESVSIGSFGNKTPHEGIWYNMEAWFNSLNAYASTILYSYTTEISTSNLATLNSIISNSDNWTYTHNCSSFAEDIWNSVVPTSLKVNVTDIETPSKLVNEIKDIPGYLINRSFHTVPTSGTNTKIGYSSGGSFITPTMGSWYQ